MGGSAIAAIISVVAGDSANAIGVGGLPGILSIQLKYMGIFALAMVVAIVVPFVLTLIIGKKKGIDKVVTDIPKIEDKVTELKAFLSGQVVAIEHVL